MFDRHTNAGIIERAWRVLGLIVALVVAFEEPWRQAAAVLLLVAILLTFLFELAGGWLHFVITWQTVRRYLKRVIKSLKVAEFKPDLVVGVRRSGSIVGAPIASNYGKAPFIAMHVEYGPRRTPYVDRQLPLNMESFRSKKILLTFCSVNTGDTLDVARQYLIEQGVADQNIACAALYVNPAFLVQRNAHPDRFVYAKKRSVARRHWPAFPWHITEDDRYE